MRRHKNITRRKCKTCHTWFRRKPDCNGNWHNVKYCSPKCNPYSGKFPIEQKFWDNVQKTPRCWLWKGSKDLHGYGYMALPGKKLCRASRYSWVLAHGPIKNSLWVLHKCDNPQCVRPSHLFLGDANDNVQDCIAKGRRRIPKGSEHYGAKLNDKKVVMIRAAFKLGQQDYQKFFAKKFKVTESLIYQVAKGRIWKHVTS